MDTIEVASMLKIAPRTLRLFLRSPVSTFTAVGSGARYDFTERDIPTIKRRFAEWQKAGKPKSATIPAQRSPAPAKPQRTDAEEQRWRDEQVWAEEGTLGVAVSLPDIKNPYVLKRVRQAEADRVARLELLMLAAGIHITQPDTSEKIHKRRKS